MAVVIIVQGGEERHEDVTDVMHQRPLLFLPVFKFFCAKVTESGLDARKAVKSRRLKNGAQNLQFSVFAYKVEPVQCYRNMKMLTWTEEGGFDL